jgi:hypothetical protein
MRRSSSTPAIVARTTDLYDRRRDGVSLDEVERIGIQGRRSYIYIVAEAVRAQHRIPLRDSEQP